MPNTRRQTSFATAARTGNVANAVAKLDAELDRLYAELDEARASIGVNFDTHHRLRPGTVPPEALTGDFTVALREGLEHTLEAARERARSAIPALCRRA